MEGTWTDSERLSWRWPISSTGLNGISHASDECAVPVADSQSVVKARYNIAFGQHERIHHAILIDGDTTRRILDQFPRYQRRWTRLRSTDCRAGAASDRKHTNRYP